MNDRGVRRIDSTALFTGLLLIALGVAFLLGDFGDIVHDWWPMFIVLVGIAKLFDRGSIWSGLWLIAIGGWLQLVRLHLFDMTFQNSWPILLIVIGGGIALRALFDVAETKERHHEP